ncbi:NADH-quinone oxidoreductase subunit C [Gleimia hominis]|uniref:NADH-quinone oxidoreductase subunit C n=1 Tax=Gleimia hominis TaxID=595468 RepID=UPI000C80CF42|nr:NADH-quinone oxidoreductase subunit C [Gleimia hominis]WIK64539.1 NADH-quinone oxidoreductase subunit C [Gleimia hominis]
MSENIPSTTGEGAAPEPQKPSGRAQAQPELVDIRTGQWGVHGSGDTTGFGGLTREVRLPGESERPYGGWFDTVVDVLEELITDSGEQVADVIERVSIYRDQMTIFITREHIKQVCQFLRDDQDLRFELCLGVSGVNYPNDKGRELHAVYALMSVTHNRMLCLEVTCPEEDPRIPSVVSVYPGNDWHERETWDLMGIIFTGHPGLTRTAMPDDWVGHPQRKDYPLGGVPVEYKGATVPPADVRRSYN